MKGKSGDLETEANLIVNEQPLMNGDVPDIIPMCDITQQKKEGGKSFLNHNL